MSKVWRYTDTHSEGKYLVVRRDGTMPLWPNFVLSAADIAAPEALRTYARVASMHHMQNDFVESVNVLADAFDTYRLSNHLIASQSNPDGAPHRIDDAMIVRAMRSPGARIHIDTINTLRGGVIFKG